MKKISLSLIFICLFAVSIVYAGTSLPHTIYGNAFNADGAQVKVSSAGEVEYISDYVGSQGADFWKVNLYNLPYPVADGDTMQILVEKGIYSEAISFEIDLSKGSEQVPDITLGYCGDSICEDVESCDICPIDCGICNPDSEGTLNLPHTLYGKAFNAEGGVIRAYLEGEENYISTVVGVEGSFGLENYWKLNLANLPNKISDGDNITLILIKNDYSKTTLFEIDLSKGNEEVPAMILGYCGDGICEYPERCDLCTADCGACESGSSSGSGSSGGSGSGSSISFSSCSPVWECEYITECNESGLREQLCVDTACNSTDTLTAVACDYISGGSASENPDPKVSNTQENDDDGRTQTTEITSDEEDEGTDSRGNLLTGNVITDLVKPGNIVPIIFLSIIILVLLIFIFKKKKKKEPWFQVDNT